MKFPLSWLKEFLPTSLEATALGNILTLSGIEVEMIEWLADDQIFHIALTPNFGHAYSLWGVARELAAHLQLTPQLPTSPLVENAKTVPIDLHIADSSNCYQYQYRQLESLTMCPTPKELVVRLERAGIRSVNIVVDVLNAVMIEFGIPLHAFDSDKFEKGALTVRRASSGETITTLDHITRTLTDEITVIADSKKALAVAGIMGAENSEVTETSRSILIEAAHFSPTHTRHSSKQLALSTEGSRRFERGVDPEMIPRALDRAAFLIQHYCGAKIAPIHKVEAKAIKPPTILCRLSRINRLLALNLSGGEVEALFKRLGFKIVEKKNADQVSGLADEIEVNIPSFRPDIEHEIDLVEEVARLYGYNHLFVKGSRVCYQSSQLGMHPLFSIERQARQALLGEGLTEWLSCDLVNEKLALAALPSSLQKSSLVRLLNPHSQAQSALRPTLLVNHLQVAQGNIDHGNPTFAAFEIARIHFSESDTYREPLMVAITLSGQAAPFHFETPGRDYDFFDLKGIVENIFHTLKVEKFRLEKADQPAFHPTRQAKVIVEDIQVAILGQVHPTLLALNGISQPLFFAELSLEVVAQLAKKKITMQPLPLFPASERDWTLTVDQNLSCGELLAAVEQVSPPLIECCELMAIFNSDKIGREWKNVTLRLRFRLRDATISQAQVESEFGALKGRVIEKLKQKMKVES